MAASIALATIASNGFTAARRVRST